MGRIDSFEDLPRDMRRYLANYGWHFSKRLCETACQDMRNRDGSKHTVISKEEVEKQLKTAGVTLNNNILYDSTYVFNMAMADYYGGCLKDIRSVAEFVHDYLDDPDGTPTRAMDEFVGRRIGAGKPIDWSDVI